MTDGTITTSSPRDGVALITIGRPDKRNALTPDMIAALHDAFDRADADKATRAIVLTGAGDTAFCAGHDIKAICACFCGRATR